MIVHLCVALKKSSFYNEALNNVLNKFSYNIFPFSKIMIYLFIESFINQVILMFTSAIILVNVINIYVSILFLYVGWHIKDRNDVNGHISTIFTDMVVLVDDQCVWEGLVDHA